MKKLIFGVILLLFLPLLVNSQEIIKKEVNKNLFSNTQTLQEMSSKLLDLYGLNSIEFVKMENGNYIPLRVDEVKKVTEVQISSDVIIIFAIIGAVLVGLILLRSL